MTPQPAPTHDLPTVTVGGIQAWNPIWIDWFNTGMQTMVLSNPDQTNITSVGKLASLTVTGAITGTLATAAQTAITQTGSNLGIGTPALTSVGYSTLTMGNTTGVFQRFFANTVESLRLSVTTVDQTLDAVVGNLVLNGTSGVNVTSPLKVGGNLIVSTTAPTIASGFGTSPSILANNTAAFQITVGSGGTASQGQITMPAAPNGWACHAQGNGALKQIIEAVGTSATNILLSNVDLTTGLPLAWAAGSIIQVMCMAY